MPQDHPLRNEYRESRLAKRRFKWGTTFTIWALTIVALDLNKEYDLKFFVSSGILVGLFVITWWPELKNPIRIKKE